MNECEEVDKEVCSEKDGISASNTNMPTESSKVSLERRLLKFIKSN